jgi:hypothetical protein
MESNHPRNVTPRNSVLKTGTATGPYPSPYNEIKHLACGRTSVQVRLPTDWPMDEGRGPFTTFLSASMEGLLYLAKTLSVRCPVIALI